MGLEVMVTRATPLISIVLATYHPEPDYFVELLRSLESQNYPQLELVVMDDSASEEAFERIRDCLEEHIQKIPFRLFRNERNLGSTKTFEMAVHRTRGEYVAFCDQDDIWYPKKLESLLLEICRKEAVLVYSDMEIINGAGAITHDSVNSKNSRILPVQGENLFSFFLQRNAVTGCSMMVTRELALQAMPYPHEWYHHDHWLALWASAEGEIAYVPKAHLAYRIHGNNQVGLRLLEGIEDRQDYCHKLEESIGRMEYLLGVFPTQADAIGNQLSNLRLRLDGFRNKRWIGLLRNKKVYGKDYLLRWFEALFSVVPAWIGRMMLYMTRRM